MDLECLDKVKNFDVGFGTYDYFLFPTHTPTITAAIPK